MDLIKKYENVDGNARYTLNMIKRADQIVFEQ